MAELTDATLEMRVAGGEWQAGRRSRRMPRPTRPAASPMLNYPVERPFLETYTAKLPVPDAGAWIDLRVTATDAAGNTFSQEIERAFEAAPSKGGSLGPQGPHGQRWPHGGRP